MEEKDKEKKEDKGKEENCNTCHNWMKDCGHCHHHCGGHMHGCGYGHGFGGYGCRRHFWLRKLILIFLAIVVFCFGVQLGEMKAQFRTARYGGYGYGPGMMMNWGGYGLTGYQTQNRAQTQSPMIRVNTSTQPTQAK